MKRFLLGTLAFAALFGAPAMAADLAVKAPVYKAPPPPPIFSWTGCYIGGNVGGAWARRDADEFTIPANFNAGPTAVTLKGSNVIGGAQIGCNYQAGVWVFGVEGDWSGTKLNDTQTALNTFANGVPVGSGGVFYDQSVKWLASVRGRVGVAVVPNVLLYVTGGGAWAKTDFSGLHAYAGGCPNCSFTSFSNTSSGWVAGGGVEWSPWSNNWLVRAEYLYYGLGSTSSLGLQQTSGLATTSWQLHRLNVQEARVGLSYLFNAGPVVARY